MKAEAIRMKAAHRAVRTDYLWARREHQLRPLPGEFKNKYQCARLTVLLMQTLHFIRRVRDFIH